MKEDESTKMKNAEASSPPAPSTPRAQAESIYPIAALSFRFAKTMPETPHEYVVRTPENESAYVALFNLIVEKGVHEKWGRRRYQYYYAGMVGNTGGWTTIFGTAEY